jgi:hypothetical protein
VKKSESVVSRPVNRRSFLKTGMLAGSAAAVPAGLMGGMKPAFGQGDGLHEGDVAILRFLAAAELIEADLWTQYAELGGIGKNLQHSKPAGRYFRPAGFFRCWRQEYGCA